MNVSIYCPHCKRHTGLSIALAKYTGRYGDDQFTEALWEKAPYEKWWIGICNYCQNPVLVLNDGEIIYPTPFPSPTDSRIPEPMHEDLIEAKLCYSIHAYRACAVMARRSLQNACLQKGASKGNLIDQVKELSENGVITRDLKEWADVVRWVGNDAAHPNDVAVAQEDAEDILNLAEQFLQILYVAPAIAESRKKTRGK